MGNETTRKCIGSKRGRYRVKATAQHLLMFLPLGGITGKRLMSYVVPHDTKAIIENATTRLGAAGVAMTLCAGVLQMIFRPCKNNNK